METKEWITLRDCCSYYDVEVTFIHSLEEFGLIEVKHVQSSSYIHEDTLPQLEKLIRLHYDLDINMEGIDVISNLLQQIQDLQREVSSLRRRLAT
ncbi:MAG: chaperone modulator CbpM [Siphonobacter sp.]